MPPILKLVRTHIALNRCTIAYRFSSSIALAVTCLLLSTSPALALSASCAALNNLNGSGSFSRMFPVESFASGETVSVSFSDTGGNIGNSNPALAESVILRNPTTFSPYYDYRSNTGSAGNHAASISAAQLTRGLFISIRTGIYLSPVTLSCTAAVSGEASLSNLMPSLGTLSPAFTSDISTYTISLASTASSITLAPTASDSSVKITVNGTVVDSGTPSPAIQLSTGPNTIIVTTTAEDRSARSYTVTVTRAPILR